MSALPRLGLGCATQGDLFEPRGDEASYEVFEAAWDVGVRHFDTAPHYGLGLSEHRLGRFLATKPRDEFVVSTKVGRLLRPNPGWDGSSPDDQGFAVPARLHREWDVSPAGVRASLEESLTRLGLDRVDVLYLHDPECSGIDGAVETGMEALASLRSEGLVDRIGTGSMAPPTLVAAVNTGLADVVMVAGRYTLLDQSVAPELLAACDGHGTRIVAAAIFNSGLLADTPRRGAMFDYAEVRSDVLERALAIADACASRDVLLPTAALHYPLLDPRVESVVIGAATAEQIRQNRARLDATVPAALWDDLARSELVPRLT
jgi:D-threo-aldose 1-dehydrogenase